MLEIINQALKHADNTAIYSHQNNYSFKQLLHDSTLVACNLLKGSNDLNESRVAFMIEPGYHWVVVQWAIWRAGGVAVPISITYPKPSIDYLIEDTQATIIITDHTNQDKLNHYTNSSNIRFYNINDLFEINSESKNLPNIDKSRNAMILYTSGTTSKPKGVVTTHKNIETQISTLIEAWEWSSADQTVNVLPLHHVHGIINVVSSGLWAGATLHFMDSFDPAKLTQLLCSGTITVFMAVPTIYFKLITYIESQNEADQKNIKNSLQKLRLMISGSAALPVSVLEKWKKISGHTLLERYGMTEIGMAISNPYSGERKPGYIGMPLPGVSIRLSNDGEIVSEENVPGEILVKGENVFKEYWNKPDATQKAFNAEGWFLTGDIAVVENGYYRILGRDSVDIIKSGGYKISALEIEEVLRSYPKIIDCSVVGIPSDEWGELVAAALVVNEELDTQELNTWMRTQMPAYKTPRKYLIVEGLPRNAMGKITKNDVKPLFL